MGYRQNSPLPIENEFHTICLESNDAVIYVAGIYIIMRVYSAFSLVESCVLIHTDKLDHPMA